MVGGPVVSARDGVRAGDDARAVTSWSAVLSLIAAGVVAAVQIGKASAALPVL